MITRIKAVGAVDSTYAQALAAQAGKYLPTLNKGKDVSAYYNSAARAWANRSDAEITASKGGWKGWIEAGKIHQSYFRDMGAMPDSTLDDLISTFKDIPKFLKKDLKAGAQVAKEIAGEGAGIVKAAIGIEGFIFIGIILLGAFFIWRKT